MTMSHNGAESATGPGKFLTLGDAEKLVRAEAWPGNMEMLLVWILRKRHVVNSIAMSGEEDQVGFSPEDLRELVKRCTQDLADEVLLAHNHPSGGPPSHQDLENTHRLAAVLAPFAIAVLDHMVIHGASVTSLLGNAAGPAVLVGPSAS